MESFFLNPWILFGLPVAAIPIIIHLLNRRRHRVIDWGAMRFLKMAFVTRHRRVRIEEILLLILRTLLLLLLLGAMARPFVTSRLFSSEENHKDLVIVLDSSFSMGLKNKGTTTFGLAKAHAVHAIETLTPGDSVGVVLTSRLREPLTGGLSYDFKKAKDQVIRTHESLSSLNMVAALDRALAMLRKGNNPIREVLIVTDGQAQGWGTDDTKGWEYIAEQVRAFDPSASLGAGRTPRVYVLRIERDGDVSNLALGRIDVQRAVVGTDRDVRIGVNVRNTGDVMCRSSRVTLTIDGKPPKVTADVEALLPGASASAVVTHRFADSGSHYIAVELEDDMLAADNRSFFGIEVLDALPVLIVDGSAAKSAFERDSLHLAAALEPTDKYVVKPTVIDPSVLVETDLAKYRAVLLVNVPQVDPTALVNLERFVTRGGGLMIVPGDRVEPEVSNRTLWKNGTGLMPAEIIKIETEAATREAPIGISQIGLRRFAPLAVLADPEKSDLADARIMRYFKLAAPGVGAGASTPLRLENGDPMLVHRKFGKGNVLAVAVPFTTDWSTLPMRNAFVVLAHELIYYLVSPLLPAQNIAAGDDLVVKLDEDDPARTVELELALGGRRELTVRRRESQREAVFEDTREAGLYKAVWRGARGIRTRYYVVNVDPAESDLTELTDDSEGIIGGQTGIRFYDNWSSLEGALKVGQDTREFWRWLAVFTLLFLLAEVVLTRQFSKRKAVETAGVSFGTK